MPELISPTKRFIWILMEEFTNLKMYPIPFNTSIIHGIVAENDAYVLRLSSIPDLTKIWDGSTVEIVPNKGHVETYFSCHSLFRNTIKNTLNKAKNFHLINNN